MIIVPLTTHGDAAAFYWSDPQIQASDWSEADFCWREKPDNDYTDLIYW